MLEIIETPIEYRYEVKDCRTLNRMEMIGFISCDIMSKNWNKNILNGFRHIYRGITQGPWSIECDPTDNSVSYIIENSNYKVRFVPSDKGMSILYYNEDLIVSTFWSIDEIEDNLI